jgi:energy-converting hydrogenase Eha subunit H
VTLPPRSGWLLAGAAASFALVVLHFGIIVAGAPAYEYFLAGKQMVDLARAHSLVPTAVTGVVAAVFTVFGLYALAGAGVIRLPAARILATVVGCIYTLRGTLVVPEAVMVQYVGRPPRALVFASVSLLIGIVHLVGVARRWHLMDESEPATTSRDR